MKFFINSGIFSRGGNTFSLSIEENELKLSIPCLFKSGKYKDINFIFSNLKPSKIERFKNGQHILLDSVSLKKVSNYTYRIYVSDTPIHDDGIFALVKGSSVIPDDVFIPSCMKNNVKLLRIITYTDSEPDVGSFNSNIYLIKIKLKYGENLPLYFTTTKPSVLDKHCVIYRSQFFKEYYSVATDLKTFIQIRTGSDDYIPLSNLGES